MNFPVDKFRSVNPAPAVHINAGTGTDVTIMELAQEIARATGFTGTIVCDPSKPDGTPRKLMDSSRINTLGWKPAVSLREGLELTYADFLSNLSHYTR
jgi:nucleoside-diphosphate-sugar epimerase